MNLDCIEIFYNEIIPEAAIGRVDCFFYRNVLFNTNIEGKLLSSTDFDATLKPTLIIKDKKEFDKKLLEYVTISRSFYEKYQDDDITEKDFLKEIMTVIWSNATVEDFTNPITFLDSRIKMINDQKLNYNNEILGEIFGQNIRVTRKKESILKETPYILEFKIGENVLPIIRYGIVDDTVYIYAIQNENSQIDKKLNRSLYKLKSGFDESGESKDNISDFENLTGITPSFMASLTLALGLFKSIEIDKIEAISYLPVRLNGKTIINDIKIKKNSTINLDELEEIKEMQIRNETDKFIRHFRRLSAQFTGLEITCMPMEVDTNLHCYLTDGTFSNNELEQLFNVAQENNHKIK